MGAPKGNRNNPKGRPRQEFRMFLNDAFDVWKRRELAKVNATIEASGDKVPKSLVAEKATLEATSTGLELLQVKVMELLNEGDPGIAKVMVERVYGKIRTQPIQLQRAGLDNPESIERTAKRLAKKMLEEGADPASVKVAVEVVRTIGEIQLNAAHTRALNAAVDDIEDDENEGEGE